MGKAIGGTIKNIGDIKEAKAKRRDGKSFIAQAKQKQRNFEAADTSSKSFANIKASDAGARLALENIQQATAGAVESAAGAGIRGIGMISQINQNTNAALAAESAKLSEKQSQIDVMAAQQEDRNVDREIAAKDKEQARIDQMLERGQGLRSQGAAESGNAALSIGTTIEENEERIMKAAGKMFGGGGGFGG